MAPSFLACASALSTNASNWARLWLNDEEADSLARELNALYDRYAALSDRKNKTVPALLHLVQVREGR